MIDYRGRVDKPILGGGGFDTISEEINDGSE